MLLTLNSIWRYLVVERYSRVTVDPLFYPTIPTRVYYLLTTPKTSPDKLTLTVVEMQQLPDIEKTVSKEELSRLKLTINNGRRKVCVNFWTDADKLNIVVYRYRNSLYLKDNGVDLKMTEDQ